MKKSSKIIKKIASVLSSILIVIEIIVIAVLVFSKMSGGVPSLLGHNMYVIASPSMSPELEVGDVIISKEYGGEALAVGDVVQYVAKSGSKKGEIITHQIISMDDEPNGMIVTKGIANSTPDDPIQRDDVISVMKYKTVVVDDIYRVIGSTWGFVLLVMLPLFGMIVFEIVNFVADIKKEKEEVEYHENNQEK